MSDRFVVYDCYGDDLESVFFNFQGSSLLAAFLVFAWPNLPGYSPIAFRYLVSGFCLAGCGTCYSFWTIHLTPQGFCGSKQRWFLLANIVLYLLVMGFYIRWV